MNSAWKWEELFEADDSNWSSYWDLDYLATTISTSTTSTSNAITVLVYPLGHSRTTSYSPYWKKG